MAGRVDDLVRHPRLNHLTQTVGSYGGRPLVVRCESLVHQDSSKSGRDTCKAVDRVRHEHQFCIIPPR